jgi:hypothetical protein
MNQKARILIVEDDTPMMVSLLTDAGYDVQTAWYADKAMRLCHVFVCAYTPAL